VAVWGARQLRRKYRGRPEQDPYNPELVPYSELRRRAALAQTQTVPRRLNFPRASAWSIKAGEVTRDMRLTPREHGAQEERTLSSARCRIKAFALHTSAMGGDHRLTTLARCTRPRLIAKSNVLLPDQRPAASAGTGLGTAFLTPNCGADS